MRHLTWIALGAAAWLPAAAAGQTPAHAHAGHSDAPASPAPRLEIVADSARDELVVDVGPIDLPAGISHHALTQMPVMSGVIPISGDLHGFRIELIDARGRPVPQHVLHHVNLIDPDHRELFLPISRRLFAAGEETGAVSMPRWLLGVPLKRGQRLMVSTMFHNPTDVSYEGVHLRIALAYTPEGSLWPILQVYPFQMDVKFPVGDKSVDLPPGRSEFSYEASPAVRGRILAMGGHMHDRAVLLRFEDVTAGEVLWEARPIENEAGHLVGVPVRHFWKKLGVPITPEHAYRVTVIYENPTGDTLYGGGMGVVGGLFLPKEPEAWPDPDFENPTYAADLRHALRLEGDGHGSHEMGSGAGGGGHGHHGR